MANTRRLPLIAIGVLALAFLAAGCGSSSRQSTPTTSTTTTAANGRTTATAAFQSCLAQHGVNLRAGAGPGGQGPGGGTPPAAGRPPTGGQGGAPAISAAQRRAFTACQSKLPASQRARLGQRPTTSSNPALTKYTACLRRHGVTFGTTNDQKTFQKATSACAKYAPKSGG